MATSRSLRGCAGLVRTCRGTQRTYTFASPAYAASFGDKPPVDVKALRRDSVEYIEKFDAKVWFDDPVCTIIKGKVLTEGEHGTTVDAFGAENGRQILASPGVVDTVLQHVRSLGTVRDLRDQVRRVEARLLSEHAAMLIGNQAIDFHKQDGVTEIEESIEANVIERRLNDLLLADETAGRVRIQRDVALIGCVSNFTNFLDLCRKTLRNLELGVPVLVLSRSNTTQHMYRWVQLLLDEMRQEGLDEALVTYVSCSIPEQRRIMAGLSHCPFYLTGSRQVAAAIKELMPHTFASTGGPNTMVVPELDSATDAAARMSSLIENSGQCTAMRHLVTNACAPNDLKRIFEGVQAVDSSADSLRQGAFDGLFKKWAASFQAASGYELLAPPASASGAQSIAFRISQGQLAPKSLEEHWRRVYLDVSTPPKGSSVKDPAFLEQLSRWLTKEQPITLAVNGDDEQKGFPMMQQLFSSTAQAIYSVGREGQPALTAQARPQDGEIFGEFPPRRDMPKYTEGPVFVPSSTPSYMARYEKQHLQAAAARAPDLFGSAVCELLQASRRDEIVGYGVLLAEYLKESCGPRHGCGQRTSLWGLQRPPMQQVSTLLRIEASDNIGAAALSLLPFLLTNAKDGLVVSLAPEIADAMANVLRGVGEANSVPIHTESDAAFSQRCHDSEPWNIVSLSLTPTLAEELPMVDHFVLRLLPMGHIKSSAANDEGFIEAFESSPKWLRYTA
eukprot:TRINITY_DN19297_c0_g3_i1.p1 TRINITY_DN19297_c0_g3~~TRINITY_DN19297_c0_g3_i1.p1  ORF type:complete len:745 (-),score=116.88 TRINITY_DN19297_c0_g3_i1:91-2283(-)